MTTYKDKVIEDYMNSDVANFLEEAKETRVANDDIRDFISNALEEQMKLTIECLPDTDYVMMLKVYQDKFKKNLKSKGLI